MSISDHPWVRMITGGRDTSEREITSLPSKKIIRAEPLDPSWADLRKAWDYLVHREYGPLYQPPLGSPQWLNYLVSGKEWSKYMNHPQAQDAMAIAPLNITPRRLQDMIERQSTHMAIASLAAMEVTKNDVENILWSSVMVSGIARFDGSQAEGHELVWRTTGGISSLRKAKYRIWVEDSSEPYVFQVPDFDQQSNSKRRM